MQCTVTVHYSSKNVTPFICYPNSIHMCQFIMNNKLHISVLCQTHLHSPHSNCEWHTDSHIHCHICWCLKYTITLPLSGSYRKTALNGVRTSHFVICKRLSCCNNQLTQSWFLLATGFCHCCSFKSESVPFFAWPSVDWLEFGLNMPSRLLQPTLYLILQNAQWTGPVKKKKQHGNNSIHTLH